MSQPESARVSLTRRTLTWRGSPRQKPRSLSGQTGTARQSPYPYADDDGEPGGHRSGKPTHGTAPRAACRAHRAGMDRWRLRSTRRRKNAPARPKTPDRLHERRRPTRPELTAPAPYAGEAQPDHVMRQRISAPPNHPRTRPVETPTQPPPSASCGCMPRRPLLPQRPGRAVDGGQRDGPQWTCGGGVDKQTVSAGRALTAHPGAAPLRLACPTGGDRRRITPRCSCRR